MDMFKTLFVSQQSSGSYWVFPIILKIKQHQSIQEETYTDSSHCFQKKKKKESQKYLLTVFC